jgi:hypothetical protein
MVAHADGKAAGQRALDDEDEGVRERDGNWRPREEKRHGRGMWGQGGRLEKKPTFGGRAPASSGGAGTRPRAPPRSRATRGRRRQVGHAGRAPEWAVALDRQRAKPREGWGAKALGGPLLGRPGNGGGSCWASSFFSSYFSAFSSNFLLNVYFTNSLNKQKNACSGMVQQPKIISRVY